MPSVHELDTIGDQTFLGTFSKAELSVGAAREPLSATFGPFSLDFHSQTLHKHGIRIKATPQTLRVLAHLVEHSSDLVVREDLFALLWPEDTHVDFTGNLNAIIRDLRVVLGDSARHPHYIQTELRRGYRFIAPVTLLYPSNNHPEPVPLFNTAASHLASMPLVSAKFSSRLTKTIAAAALLLACFVWAARALVPKAANPLPLPQITQLTNLAGRAGHATLSPDGSRIAFHWDGNESGGFDIYIGELGHEKFVRLTHDAADDLYPAWSPDGRDIAFLRRFPDGRCSIYLIPTDGGVERFIRDVPTESSLSWSADGRWLAYTVLYKTSPTASSPDFGVYAVSLLTREVVRITHPPTNVVGDEDGTFSPDGHRIAFFRSSSMGVSDLYIQELGSKTNPVGGPKQITFNGQNARNGHRTAQALSSPLSRAACAACGRLPSKGMQFPFR